MQIIILVNVLFHAPLILFIWVEFHQIAQQDALTTIMVVRQIKYAKWEEVAQHLQLNTFQTM